MPDSDKYMPWEATRRALAGELASIDGVLPGSVVVRPMRCGKPGCACKNDTPVLHGPYIQATTIFLGFVGLTTMEDSTSIMLDPGKYSGQTWRTSESPRFSGVGRYQSQQSQGDAGGGEPEFLKRHAGHDRLGQALAQLMDFVVRGFHFVLGSGLLWLVADSYWQ